MIKLKKLLTNSSKTRRHRRKILNVQITFLAWLVESIGFLVIFLGTFILGHENNIFNFFMQTITLIIYFILLPFVFLLNDFDIKSTIVDSQTYEKILNMFHCNYTNSIDGNAENSVEAYQIQNENESNPVVADEDNFGNAKRNAKLFKRTFQETINEHVSIENRKKDKAKRATQDNNPGKLSNTEMDVIIDETL